MKIIELKNIEFNYIDKSKNVLFSLSNINFDISKTEYISILGSNGSGKSTFLKILAGILKPKSGTINLEGDNILKLTPQNIAKIIAYVPQLYYSIYPFSVFEIVMMGRTPFLNKLGFETKKDVEIVNQTMENVGIFHLRNKSINEVSGGEAQRAYVARALVQNPKVILLDEPNSHLDIKNEIYLFSLLEELRSTQNLSIAIITHHLNLANIYSSRVVLFKEGNIVNDGHPNEVLNEVNLRKVFSLSNNIIVKHNHNDKTINLIPN